MTQRKGRLSESMKCFLYAAAFMIVFPVLVTAGHYGLNYFIDKCGDAYQGINHMMHPLP